MNKKMVGRFLLWMAGGLIVGLTVVFALTWMRDQTWLTGDIAIIPFLQRHLLWIQLLVFAGLFVPSVILIMRNRQRNGSARPDVDGDVDPAMGWDRISRTAAMLNQIYIVTAVIVVAGLFRSDSPLPIVNTAVFCAGIIGAAIHEVVIIRSNMQRDDRLQGDPTSIRFEWELLDSLDERERLWIYRAGFKTYTRTKWILMVLLIFSVYTHFTLHTGLYPIVLLGGLYLYQIIAYERFLSRNP